MIGYGYLNIFCQQGKKISPEDATHRAYVLNEGGHQIPLYYGEYDRMMQESLGIKI